MSSIKRVGSVAQWVVIPLVVFGAVEAVYRANLQTSSDWYRENVPADGAEQVLFAGTSRTRSALSEEAFVACFAPDEAPTRVVNLGMGNSTQAIHLHALRSRVWENPDALQNTTLFVETALGVPSFYFPDEFYWDEVRHEEMPWRWHLYLDATSVSDPGFLWSSHLDLEGRLKLLARAPTSDFLLLGKREIVGMQWRSKLTAALQKLAGHVEPKPSDDKPIDLDAGGGIRVDAEGVEAMGEFERRMTEALEPLDARLPAPEDTPAGALIQFALDHGADVVCVDIPVHTRKRRGFDSQAIQGFKKEFERFLDERGVPRLQADFSFTDDDFPDRSHLAKSRSGEFTEKVFEAWESQRSE